jgi:OOP family OmpA-OmpF porin
LLFLVLLALLAQLAQPAHLARLVQPARPATPLSSWYQKKPTKHHEDPFALPGGRFLQAPMPEKKRCPVLQSVLRFFSSMRRTVRRRTVDIELARVFSSRTWSRSEHTSSTKVPGEQPVKNTKKIALAAAILCAAGPSLAQDIDPAWYMQPSLSGLHPDKRFGVDENGVGLGFRFGKAIHPNIDIQFGASHARLSDSPVRYRQTLLGIDALFMMSRNRFRPFLLLGVGAQRDEVRTPLGKLRENSPYVSAGIGFQLVMNERWTMQADFRNVHGRMDDAFGFDRANNKYLTIGFNYAFRQPAPPAPPPAPRPEPVVQAPPEPPPPPPPPTPPPARFEKVTLSATELFAFNSATLTMPQPRLDEISAALAADPGVTDVDITGYADRLGSEAYNLRLSEQRANAVRDYLISRGIDAARLRAIGRGEANPVIACRNKNRAELIKCLEPNRRVEVEQITVERRVE